MIRKESLLDSARIASPCPALWSEMEGDDEMRYCKLCKLNVFDVSQMTSEEAERMLREKSGRLCMRIYRRADGRILTKDCPVGVSGVRRRIVYMCAGAFAICFAALAKASTFWTSGETPADSEFGVIYAQAKEKAVQAITGKKATPPTPPSTTGMLMGDVALFVPPTGAKVTPSIVAPTGKARATKARAKAGAKGRARAKAKAGAGAGAGK